MPRIFCLLTGVATYHPESGVGSLTGSVNDVNGMESYLTKRFPQKDLSIKKLVDEQAGRKDFIDVFINHLIKNPEIAKGDIVLFYYSGHGSYATSNPAFAKWDSEKRDETLVLYDSRCKGGFDLADKELHLLISKIPSQANIIIILDSCHSGSATRNVDDLDAILLGKPKHAPERSNDTGRKLSEYLTIDGKGYEQMVDGNGLISIPNARYLAMSACDRYEVAYESSFSPEGMFTSSLLKALDAGPVNLSYAKLYEYLYTLLKRKARKQTPQLESYEGFDPDTIVFSNEKSKGETIYQVTREGNGKITIDCGALHGLKNDERSMKSMTVSFYDKDNPGEAAKLAKITAVGLDKSELQSEKITPKVYQAAVLNLPPAVCILVTGTKEQQQSWDVLAKQMKKENLAFVYAEDQQNDYVLRFNPDNLSLTIKDNGKLVHGISDTTEKGIRYMIDCCNQVCAWHQLLAMTNNSISEKAFENTFKTKFGVELLDEGTGEWKLQKGDDHVLYLDEQHKTIPFRIHLDSDSPQSWYCAVFYMNGRFCIKKITGPVNEAKLSKNNSFDVFEKPLTLGLKDGEEQSMDYFKLIICKESFKDFLVKEFEDLEPEITSFTEKGFAMKTLMEDSIDQNWYAKTLSIKSLKRSGKIDAATTFTQGKLTIHPHNAIKATASVTPIDAQTKGIHPSQQLQQLVEASGLEMVNLDNSKSADAATSIVWIDGIEGDVSDKPLQVSLQEAPTDDSELVAMTMEDGVVQLIGVGAPNENGGYDLEIKTLPEDNQRKKSLIRAAWFCFVKVALRKDLSELRKVTYTDGKVDYDKNISQIIQPGQRVAVLVHGIIGNTKGMASSMEFLLTNKNYDLLLAFDYENLNTKIEKIAEKLKELLEKAGAGVNAPVDIICHSMGGLVSRYMIEHVPDTDGWVKRLYMFGTPNAGSVFGEIPKMRDWAVGLLTIACNFGASWLGSIGVVLKSVNKVLAGSVVATYTLAEMADDSDFYKLLNKQEKTVATEYHIIAGNVLNFKPQDDDGRFARIMEKIKKQVGEWAYGSTTKNDIAVAVQSILSAPKGYIKTNVEIACHHLNYFEVDEPMKYFKTLIASNNG